MEGRIEVHDTPNKGVGLFAKELIPRGEIAYTLKQGRRVTQQEIVTLTEREKAHLDKLGDNIYEIVEPPGCYVNHSCEPNIKERDRVAYALRDIQKDEEITIDYDRISYLEKPFVCHCGSKKCRGIVRGKSHGLS